MTSNLLRILIIEDNTDHIELLSQVIERHFASIDLHTVESIEDAIDFIEQTEYDLVFTDCYINNTSIVDQLPHLRNKLGNVPIIVVTGSGDESLAANVIKKGANEYLVKTKDSLEKIPLLIKKYITKAIKPSDARKSQKTTPLKEKILDEVANLNKQARHMTSASPGRIPDIKQLEMLIEQIQHLKELASKLMEK